MSPSDGNIHRRKDDAQLPAVAEHCAKTSTPFWPLGGARAPWFAWSYFAPQRAPRLSQNQESATTFRSLKPLCQRHGGPAGVRRSDTICVYCNTACAGDCWGKQQDKEIGRLKRKLVEVEAREERLLKQANTREEGHIVSLVNCYTELDTALLFLPAPGCSCPPPPPSPPSPPPLARVKRSTKWREKVREKVREQVRGKVREKVRDKVRERLREKFVNKFVNKSVNKFVNKT